jgi:hypothetical protein
LSILFFRIKESGLEIPPEAMRLLADEYERNAFHCLTNAAELLAMLEIFSEAEIPAMPFKGIVLGASTYQNINMRQAGDLDLLIRWQDLLPATKILLDRGYLLKTLVHPDGSPALENYYEYHFERPSDGMVLELRWRLELTQPRFRRNLGLDWVWQKRQTAALAGATVPNLDPVSSLLVLCMHGSKHTWSRLIWVCDVARLLERHPDLNWNDAQREAKQTGLWRALALGVLLAARFSAASVPDAILRAFERDAGVRRLAEYFDQNLLREPGSVPKSRVPYNFWLLGNQDRLIMLASLSFFRPTPQDRAAMTLPKVLEPLYYVIRPFRLLFDRSGRR